MHLAVTKTEGSRHHITVVRKDRTAVALPMADYGRALPHDLAHVVVESVLGLDHGFWGLMAAGAAFDTLNRAAAGSRPLRRTDPVIEAHLDELLVAEGLVNLFREQETEGAVDDGRYVSRAEELCAARGTPMPALLDVAAVGRVRRALAEMNEQWQALPHGETLYLEFPMSEADP